MSNGDIDNLGLYVHWPFCKKKCPYCDFNSHVRNKDLDEDAYLESFLADLVKDSQRIQMRPLKSIFFGGGTPSLMPPKLVEKIIDKAQSIFSFTNDIEITLEANPTSVEAENFKSFKNSGINRVSLGVQSLNDEALESLGREHNSYEALKAVEIAQNTFDRWSFDMIYARPNQTVSEWEVELRQAVGYIGGHMSLYQLTIEDGTDFKRRFDKGELILPIEDDSTEMYNLTGDYLSTLGYNAYEVSNYAKAGDESMHNLIYWRYGDYMGIGAGAHGRLTMQKGKFATERERIPERWLKSAPNYKENKLISPQDQAVEAMLMGLRLMEGVPEQRIRNLTGEVGFSDIIDMNRLNVCMEQGLLSLSNDILKPTPRGRLCLNSLLSYIL